VLALDIAVERVFQNNADETLALLHLLTAQKGEWRHYVIV
jgi:hypothetical protein